MRIFLSYRFRESNSWIKELVAPLIEAFNLEFITGEEMRGEEINSGIKNRIGNSEAVMAFLTYEVGQKSPSLDWIRSEMEYAYAKNKIIVVIKDKRVKTSRGFLENSQRIDFDEDNKAALLIQLAKLFSKWKYEFQGMHLFIMPKDIAFDLREYFNRDITDKIECFWQAKIGFDESEEKKAKIVQMANGICAEIIGFPSEANARIKLRIKCEHSEWRTNGFVPFRTYSKLQKI